VISQKAFSAPEKKRERVSEKAVHSVNIIDFVISCAGGGGGHARGGGRVAHACRHVCCTQDFARRVAGLNNIGELLFLFNLYVR
jgi:hypothetical protein